MDENRIMQQVAAIFTIFMVFFYLRGWNIPDFYP